MNVFSWLPPMLREVTCRGSDVVLVEWPGRPAFELRVHLGLPRRSPGDAAVAAVLAGAMGTDLIGVTSTCPDVAVSAVLGPVGLLVEASGRTQSLPAVLDAVRTVVMGAVSDAALARAVPAARLRSQRMVADPGHALGSRLLGRIGTDVRAMASPPDVPADTTTESAVALARDLQASIVRSGRIDVVLVSDDARLRFVDLEPLLPHDRQLPDHRGPVLAETDQLPTHPSRSVPGRTQIGLVSPVVTRDDADHPAVELAHHLLGGHAQSRLSLALRHQHALATTPDGPLTSMGTAAFSLWRMDVPTSDVPAVLSTVAAVTSTGGARVPGQAELERAVRELTVNELVSAHTPAGLATSLIAYAACGARPRDLVERRSRLAGVGGVDVRRVIGERLVPSVLHGIVVGDGVDDEGSVDELLATVSARSAGMSHAPDPSVVDRFGTAARHVVVRRAGQDYEWSRHRGPRAPDRSIDRTGPLDLLAARHPAMALAVTATGVEPSVVRLRGGWSLASLLLGRCGPAGSDLASLGHLGVEQVAAWRGVPAPVRRPPRQLRELQSWWRGADDDPGLGALRARITTGLGTTRTHRIDGWIEEIVEVDRPSVVHGECGLGIMVPAHDGSGLELIAPPRWSSGPDDFDLGWLWGELRELLGRVPAEQSTTREVLTGMVTAIEGRIGDPVAGRRIAVLRSLHHLRDYQALVGHPPDLADAVRAVVQDVDRCAASTAAWGT